LIRPMFYGYVMFLPPENSMRILLKSAAGLLLTGMFFTVVSAFDLGGSPNPKPADSTGETRTTAPEIHPVTAGAVGVLLVGGIALLTTRRRARPAKL
jgi:hypothetical protein